MGFPGSGKPFIGCIKRRQNGNLSRKSFAKKSVNLSVAYYPKRAVMTCSHRCGVLRTGDFQCCPFSIWSCLLCSFLVRWHCHPVVQSWVMARTEMKSATGKSHQKNCETPSCASDAKPDRAVKKPRQSGVGPSRYDLFFGCRCSRCCWACFKGAAIHG